MIIRILLLPILFTLLSLDISAQVIYVNHAAVGANDGTSWTNAFNDLQLALNSSNYGDQIWVAQGTYTPSPSNRNLSFVINNGRAVYGGFNGTETNLASRNYTSNYTILSGEIGVAGDDSDNSYTVVYFYNVNPDTRLDGFTISDGNANQTTGISLAIREKAGAAIYNSGSGSGSNSSPTIANCIFTNNKAQTFGAAIYNDAYYFGNASPSIENCSFLNNQANVQGGAVFNNGSESGLILAQFTDCQFKSNVADDGNDDGFGGAVYNNGFRGQASPVFNNCIFNDNFSNRNGAGVYNNGYDGIANPTFNDCFFTFNSSGAEGAGLYNAGNTNGLSNPIIRRCSFIGNHAVLAGAGIFNTGVGGESSPLIEFTTFAYNVTDTYGAALYNLGKSGKSNPVINNCLFYRNDAYSAGAIYNLGTVNGESSPIISNCTFALNNAFVGGAVYNNALDTDQSHTGVSAPSITNCIFWGNTAPDGHIFRNNNGQPLVTNCLFDAADCDGLQSGTNSMVSCGTGLIFNQDPLFINSSANNFRLEIGSPAINTGDNTKVVNSSDIAGNSRIQMGTVDMGAFESDYAILPIELDAFTATTETFKVRLDWTTISERMNARFVIQRSIDGRNFVEIGTLVGAGNSFDKIAYEFFDNSPMNGVNYYRLKQIDINGDYTYSGIRTAIFDKPIEVSYFPNPVRSGIHIYTDEIVDQSTDLKIYTQDGKLIYTRIIDLRDGVFSLNDPSFLSLQSGAYWINLNSNSFNWTGQLVKE